jgi:hypothetical protein
MIPSRIETRPPDEPSFAAHSRHQFFDSFRISVKIDLTRSRSRGSSKLSGIAPLCRFVSPHAKAWPMSFARNDQIAREFHEASPALLRTSTALLLETKLELRAMTNSHLIRDKPVTMSSTTSSAK